MGKVIDLNFVKMLSNYQYTGTLKQHYSDSNIAHPPPTTTEHDIHNHNRVVDLLKLSEPIRIDTLTPLLSKSPHPKKL